MAGRAAFVSGKKKQHTGKVTTVGDGSGRPLWSGANRPGRMHGQTTMRTEGIAEQLRLHPTVKAEVDEGDSGRGRHLQQGDPGSADGLEGPCLSGMVMSRHVCVRLRVRTWKAASPTVLNAPAHTGRGRGRRPNVGHQQVGDHLLCVSVVARHEHGIGEFEEPPLSHGRAAVARPGGAFARVAPVWPRSSARPHATPSRRCHAPLS
ncbi:hypothetical protein AB0L75_25420 [Streptomyces sp. NPDC052101]|uniref:hypothetical protein n=1 Tax=Streptomyces sp. NPDC052101 TaxID=3155763 RepID=UPI00343DCB0F